MTELKPVRLGIIGCGNISSLHIQSLATVPGAEIVALVDINPDNIVTVQEKFPHLANVQTFADYHEVLKTDVDGVLILTPHGLHYQQIGDALRANKHVLTEKPFVTQPSQARELIALADERQLILMVSYQVARLWPYRYTRQQIVSGELGEIVFYSSLITQNWGRAGGWRRNPELGEGGMLVDTGSHFIDLMLFLTGMTPESVVAFSQSDAEIPSIDPTAVGVDTVDLITGALVRFNGGRVAMLSVVGRGPTLWNITIVGTKGTIELTDRDDIQHIGADNYDGWIGTKRHNLVPAPALRKDVLTPNGEFVEAIRHNDLTTTDAQRGLVVAQLTQAILASAHDGGQPVQIEALG